MSARLIPRAPFDIARRPLSFHDGRPSELYLRFHEMGDYDESIAQEGGPLLEYRQFQESVTTPTFCFRSRDVHAQEAREL